MTNRAGRLNGKVCIITGTGGSMGAAAALSFAAEGGKVVGCDVNSESSERVQAEVRAAGGEMVALHSCDLTVAENCQALVDLAVSTYGKVDVLYNNAAMAYFGWIEDFSNEDWMRNQNEEVNLVWLLTKAAWSELKKSSGVIVNTA